VNIPFPEIPAAASVCIIGGPKTGKSTYSDELREKLFPGSPASLVIHSDDFIDQFDWSGVSKHLSELMESQPLPWIMEGVAVVRALRKWLVGAEAQGLKGSMTRPCDVILVMNDPLTNLTSGQNSMRKSCDTVWWEIEARLQSRAVTVLKLRRGGDGQLYWDSSL
jgi:hypothetical protein